MSRNISKKANKIFVQAGLATLAGYAATGLALGAADKITNGELSCSIFEKAVDRQTLPAPELQQSAENKLHAFIRNLDDTYCDAGHPN